MTLLPNDLDLHLTKQVRRLHGSFTIDLLAARSLVGYKRSTFDGSTLPSNCRRFAEGVEVASSQIGHPATTPGVAQCRYTSQPVDVLHSSDGDAKPTFSHAWSVLRTATFRSEVLLTQRSGLAASSTLTSSGRTERTRPHYSPTARSSSPGPGTPTRFRTLHWRGFIRTGQ